MSWSDPAVTEAHGAMRILFLTHYFPPEVNAPASRTYENAKRWVKAGHDVTVITCIPNHPNGIPYPGYKNRPRQWDEMDGIRILRVGTYLGPNKGFFKRTLNYVSYMLSATFWCRLVEEPHVVISTSPQFFCGMAGLFVSRLKKTPWVLEIRDLWPESIVAVGAISNPAVIGFLERLEKGLYRRADHIVSVTRSFKRHIQAKGTGPEKITVIRNGADLDFFRPREKENAVRKELGIEGKFVASYIGTHGMAHGLDVVLDAASMLKDDPRFVFLLVGDGAERERLVRRKKRLGLDNVIMLPQQPKKMIPLYIAASDVCLVVLKKTQLFKTVVPSKMFEAMAMARPVILGVEGESRDLILKSGSGVYIEPENPHDLSNRLLTLANQPEALEKMGRNGREFVGKYFNRDILALKYLEILMSISSSNKSRNHPRIGISYLSQN